MKKLPIFLFLLIALLIIGWFAFLIGYGNLQVFNPAGQIASQERNLIFTAMGILLAVAIPVFLTGIFFARKYRSGNNQSHDPDMSGKKIVVGYWAFFGTVCLIFFGIVWISAHRLDPYNPIKSSEKPVTIQVVALDWKWLFIYPEEGIATVNFIQIPVNTPVNFKLTADAPMNSFWIPQLSGQIYSMTTMETQIHIIANKTGNYDGGAAEINGKGFAGMRFIVRATSKSDFKNWVEQVKNSPNDLDLRTFQKLDKPSEDVPITYYSTVDPTLYNSIIMKYMEPSPSEMMFSSREMEGVKAK
jgi:cytochrome o ubiquinol oxidase subunit 2